MHCCRSILEDLTCSKYLKIKQDTATAILEANFSKELITEDVKIDKERAWLQGPIDPKPLQEEQWTEAQSNAYILLTKHAFKDRKLPSGEEFMIGNSLRSSLSVYCDQIAEDHNSIAKNKDKKINFTLYDLTRSHLFMNCCYKIYGKIDNRVTTGDHDANELCNQIMVGNFSPRWNRRPKLLVRDEENCWFDDMGGCPEDLRDKGVRLLERYAFKDMTPPTNNDLMEEPLSNALYKYFNQVAKEKGHQDTVSDEAHISISQTDLTE